MKRAFLVHHAKSGIVALNVVTAAVEGRARVVFARDAAALVRELRESLARGERPIAGWSFYSPDFAAMATDLHRVQAEAPGATHVAGGVHASAEPLQTLRAGFDWVAIGEGETTAVRLVADGEDPRTIPGMAWLEAGRLRSNGPGERRPLDHFPAFNAPSGKWNAIEITRGCVYACSFCQTPFMFKARFRHRSVQNVREHIRWMKRDGIRYMRFLTPTCLSYGSADTSVNLDAVEELLAAVRQELPDGRIYFGTFPSECRPEHITQASLRILRKYVDNDGLVIGGQSGSERLLRETHRGHGVEDVVSAVRLSVEAGFRPDVDFLLGLPGETADDRTQSVALARRLVAMGARIHSHAFMPLPGTPLRGALPTPIDPDTMRELERMESAGSMYGQWRKHQRISDELVILRAARH
jgi:B12-binding domain/radical SAM domain protein